jgi:hypothetical protein
MLQHSCLYNLQLVAKMTLKTSSILLLCSIFLLFNTSAYSHKQNSEFYIGISGGISLPLKDKFQIIQKDKGGKEKTVTTSIKKSYMTTISLGHSIAKGSAIEFAVDIKPKFNMNVALFDDLGSNKTQASANVYMINFVYDLLDLQNFTPYFSAGIGLADIRLKQMTINHKDNPNTAIFKIAKNHHKTLAFQAGLGVTHPISQAIELDISAKIHAIKSIKIKYQKMDEGQFINQSTKQHLGMLDVTAGLIFSF